MQNPDDAAIRDILTETRLIALVGASANPARPSHGVMRFLQSKGYRVIPVNPGLAGQDLLGEAVYASVAEVPQEVDMVDIFRASDAVPGVVTAALARWPGLRTVWMQLGVVSKEGAEIARARGVTVVQDRCPAIEYPRLIG
ncbi:MAG: CoA-binding protein [Limimaricola sp.]|uniref:CoA-binding protein n=1 Tax=Limimaricola sp. TaxID=2211665 RepID=UPI001DD749D5|nr:CoA-binding protein [Limimaricola sp.]MBI1418914.1 CoA-binding protein [Limimaricola sp.]